MKQSEEAQSRVYQEGVTEARDFYSINELLT